MRKATAEWRGVPEDQLLNKTLTIGDGAPPLNAGKVRPPAAADGKR